MSWVIQIFKTIKIDEYLDGGWNEYDQNISDHRPVAIKLEFWKAR